MCCPGMTPGQLQQVEGELASFLEGFLAGLGRSERREACANYLHGLLLDGERKSMEPMSERLWPEEASRDAFRQRMQEAIGQSPWDETAVLAPLACHMEESLGELVEAVALDDTDVLKKGHHSVGVALQWVSRLKAVENCQVLVGLHLVGQTTSCPLRLRLYLPKEWADNPLRREEAGIPEGVHFEEKWRIGLRLLRQARRWGLRCRTVVADAAYGDVLRLRRRLRKLGYTYGLGIRSGQVFWAPRSGLTVDVPLPVETLAAALPKSSWRKVHWRDGTKGPLKGRFAALRVQAAPDWTKGKKPQAEEWLLIEWPEDAQQPVHYWLSNLPLSATLKQLVRLCTLRSRVELDYQQLKGELGLTHYEGRSWRGLHHHAAMCVLAYAFLALQRAFPPSTRRHPHPARRPAPAAERTAAATGLLPHLPQASL